MRTTVLWVGGFIWAVMSVMMCMGVCLFVALLTMAAPHTSEPWNLISFASFIKDGAQFLVLAFIHASIYTFPFAVGVTIALCFAHMLYIYVFNG